MKLTRLAHKIFSSPRLTLFLLAYSVLGVFLATLAQGETGVELSKKFYFESFFPVVRMGKFPIPVLGGASVALLAAVNIAFSCAGFAKLKRGGLGLSLVHTALLLLIVSGFIEYFTMTEAVLTLKVGDSSQTVSPVRGPVERAGETAPIRLPFEVGLADFKEEKWEGSLVAKSYSSRLVFNCAGEVSEAVVEMNRPASYGGWTFYQTSRSADGKVSVLSAVKNPARFLPWLCVCSAFAGTAALFLPAAFGGGKTRG